MKVIKPVEKTVLDNKSFLNNKFIHEVNEINKKLHNIYWACKLQKNPTKAKFRIAAPNYSVEPLLKAVTTVLKLIFRQADIYNFKFQYYFGVKTTVQSNKVQSKKVSPTQ